MSTHIIHDYDTFTNSLVHASPSVMLEYDARRDSLSSPLFLPDVTLSKSSCFTYDSNINAMNTQPADTYRNSLGRWGVISRDEYFNNAPMAAGTQSVPIASTAATLVNATPCSVSLNDLDTALRTRGIKSPVKLFKPTNAKNMVDEEAKAQQRNVTVYIKVLNRITFISVIREQRGPFKKK